MKSNRFWIEIVGLATAIACVLALLLATLGAAAASLAAQRELKPGESGQANESAPAPHQAHAQQIRAQQTHEGMVTCSRCGAKHSAELGKTATDCTRQCVRGGAAFTLLDGDTTYTLDGDFDRLKRVAGQRARILGVVRGSTITVSSVAASS
jgi:hypothetical protein